MASCTGRKCGFRTRSCEFISHGGPEEQPAKDCGLCEAREKLICRVSFQNDLSLPLRQVCSHSPNSPPIPPSPNSFLFRHPRCISTILTIASPLTHSPYPLSFREKIFLILKATRTHARNLGLFCLIYKSAMLALRHLNAGKERRYDSFFAGLLGGAVVFAPSHSSVSQQIVIYIFARVMLSLAKLAIQPRDEASVPGAPGGWGLVPDPVLAEKIRRNTWPVFSSLCWAMVMYLFRWHPETVQASLRSSMHYM